MVRLGSVWGQAAAAADVSLGPGPQNPPWSTHWLLFPSGSRRLWGGGAQVQAECCYRSSLTDKGAVGSCSCWGTRMFGYLEGTGDTAY